MAGVQYILDSVMASLERDIHRTFAFAEMVRALPSPDCMRFLRTPHPVLLSF